MAAGEILTGTVRMWCDGETFESTKYKDEDLVIVDDAYQAAKPARFVFRIPAVAK